MSVWTIRLPESTNVRAAYIITYNEDTVPDGMEISVQRAIPYTRKELDLTNLITLDTVNNTIKFNIAGYYKVNKFADKKRHLHRCLSSLFNFFYTEKTI